jgi:hypothetical protein
MAYIFFLAFILLNLLDLTTAANGITRAELATAPKESAISRKLKLHCSQLSIRGGASKATKNAKVKKQVPFMVSNW